MKCIFKNSRYVCFFAVIILLVFSISLFVLYLSQEERKERDLKLKGNLAELKDFTPTQTYKLIIGSIWLSIDENNRKIAVVEEATTRVYDYAQILGVELLKDDVLVASKSTSRTLGGTVVGGVLAGGAGMVVGGLSGKQKIEKEYSKISLNLIVKDIRESTICLLKDIPENYSVEKLLYEGKEVTTSVTQTLYLAQDLKNTISVIIDQVDREQNIANEREKESKTGADELLKYHELLEKGIITTNELNEVKRKILSR